MCGHMENQFLPFLNQAPAHEIDIKPNSLIASFFWHIIPSFDTVSGCPAVQKKSQRVLFCYAKYSKKNFFM